MSTIISCWREYVIALSATLITATAGTTVGWTSPTLPLLLAPSSPIPTTPDQSSWIASLMILSSAASPVAAAFLTERYGPKPTLLLAAIPYIIGWVIVIEAHTVAHLYISRMVSGIGYGLAYTVAPMYLGEIASNKVRGSMASLITVMSKAGILSQFCIGPYVSMPTLAGLNLIPPIAFFIIFLWLPESPYYYLAVDKPERAEKSLQRLRGKANVKAELDTMDSFITDNLKHKGKWKDLITVEENRRALIIILSIYTTQQLCGSTAVISYAQQIFTQAEGLLDPRKACIIFGTVQLLTSAMSSLLIDRLGRKPLLIVSSTGVGLSTFAVGTYFLVKHLNVDPTMIKWIPLTGIVIFICSYTIGLATVPFAITSEMFPTNIKPLATCVIQTYTAVITFAVTKLYQVVADDFGTYIAFWVFSFCSFAGLLFIIFVLPETKGQSFAVIQGRLKMKSIKSEKTREETDLKEEKENEVPLIIKNTQ